MTAASTAATGSAVRERERWLDGYRFGLRLAERGHVISVGDGIVWVGGMPRAAIDDVLQFEDGSLAQVFDLSRDRVGGVLLQHTEQLTAGTSVHRTRAVLSLPVGDGLLGRIIDPLGNPLDGNGRLSAVSRRARLERDSPPITAREFVNRPLCTGCRIIDCLVPIGRGQRQLLIGDEGLGRSALAIDAVIRQRDQGVLCVYVLIGQKRSTTVNTIDTLRRAGAMNYTTVVVGEAGALPGLQHLAPFAGCALAEHWMRHGRDTLVVYDDLSTHARNYRELSLLLRRPPGREAYPGDIFSLHARLLERATCLNAGAGGGSMTALPIVETSEGEIAAYIPTNLISITDGQVHLDRELFAAGFRPAIDIGLSVSRIGGQAQHPAIKQEAGRMKLDFLQFLELEAFTRFGTRLEAGMQASIERGRRLREILKQDRLQPQPIELQLAWMIAFNDHLFDAVPLEELPQRLQALAQAIDAIELTLDADRGSWASVVRDLLGPVPSP